MNELENRINFLTKKIKEWQFIKDMEPNKEIFDELYNFYRKELESLESEVGVKQNSPSLYVGKVMGNMKIQRTVPMLSLLHSYKEKEIIDFIEKHEKYSNFVIEPKIDGVAISIIYKDFLESISLRGNGWEGEDITRFAHFLNIPYKVGENMEVRGECYLPKTENQKQKRNFVAGYFRKNNPENCGVKFCSYRTEGNFQTECLEKLKSLGFDIVPFKVGYNQNDIITISKELHKFDFSFETDGVVIKLNNINYGKQLGTTERYEKNAIAYKFSERGKETYVKKINWSISKEGKLIPVALVEEINMGGAKITNCHCHNKRYLETNSIGINSKVIVTRVGNTIPIITQVIESTNFEPLLNCPFCNNILTVTKLNYICENKNCFSIVKQKVQHFFSLLKIPSLGPKLVENLLLKTKSTNLFDILENIILILKTDFYTNKNEEKAKLSFENKRKNITMENIILALGIPLVGSLKNINNSTTKKSQSLKNFLDTNNDKVEKIYNLITK